MAIQSGSADSWWQFVDGPSLNRGDLINDCYIPILLPNFNPFEGELVSLDLEIRSVIVITQSCDLENGKALLSPFALFIPLAEWEEANPEFRAKGRWEAVRQGRVEGLHLLAGQAGRRARLQSPYLEHFAQAFARFFMRVGLPSNIAKF